MRRGARRGSLTDILSEAAKYCRWGLGGVACPFCFDAKILVLDATGERNVGQGKKQIVVTVQLCPIGIIDESSFSVELFCMYNTTGSIYSDGNIRK